MMQKLNTLQLQYDAHLAEILLLCRLISLPFLKQRAVQLFAVILGFAARIRFQSISNQIMKQLEIFKIK